MSEVDKKTPVAREAEAEAAAQSTESAPVVASEPTETAPVVTSEPTAAVVSSETAPVVASEPPVTVSTETVHEKEEKGKTVDPIVAAAEPAAAQAAALAPNESTAADASTTTAPAPAPAPAVEKAESAPESTEKAAPTTGEKAPETAPAPALPTKNAVTADIDRLWEVAKAHAHNEIWGVTLADPASHVPSQIVLQKYLNANDGDFASAKDQLVKTLDWRQKMKPLELIKKKHSESKFGALGYVTAYAAAEGAGPESKDVFTWNIYGASKSMEETFGNLEEFIRWRVALMELALGELALSTATKRITATEDPYKIYQVHDYKSISFLRPPAAVKSASKETIMIFSANYPELLREKLFINVPALMGFMYGVMKLFVAAKTLKKFHPMSNGGALASEFASAKVKGLGDMLPKEYGGKGEALGVVGKQTLLE